MPAGLGRLVEVVLAEAGFEYWPGMQRTVVADCRAAAVRANAGPGERVRILPRLPWAEVPAFLAGAAVTVVASTSPETFCNTAAEALSVGTPVVAYNLGHVPALVGDAGLMVPASSGPEALWAAVARLMSDAGGYRRAASAGPRRLAAHTPRAAARAFLAATTLPAEAET